MPLHRDIHWIGRQWAVTGHGMQLIDQKLQGFFDIGVDRLWDGDLIEAMYGKEWLNAADFDKGLAVARARYRQPTGAAPAPPREVAPLRAVEPGAPPPPLPPVARRTEPKPEAPKLVKPAPVEPPRAVVELQASAIAAPVAVEPPKPPSLFQMRYACRARFVRPWRVVPKRKT